MTRRRNLPLAYLHQRRDEIDAKIRANRAGVVKLRSRLAEVTTKLVRAENAARAKR